MLFTFSVRLPWNQDLALRRYVLCLLLQILSHPPSRREHGYDAVVLLALLVNYRKYEVRGSLVYSCYFRNHLAGHSSHFIRPLNIEDELLVNWVFATIPGLYLLSGGIMGIYYYAWLLPRSFVFNFCFWDSLTAYPWLSWNSHRPSCFHWVLGLEQLPPCSIP